MPRLSQTKKQNKPNKNIGIFGASFDPPHRGHLAVIKHLLTKGDFDELWLIPTYKHAFGKTLSSFSVRIQMLKCLLGRLHRSEALKISRIEKSIPQRPTYTWHVIRALKKKHPNNHFTLIIGSDVKKDLPHWYKIKNLQKIVSFCFIPRKGYEKSPFPHASSSDIRERVKNGKSISGLTSRNVESFIKIKGLYLCHF